MPVALFTNAVVSLHAAVTRQVVLPGSEVVEVYEQLRIRDADW